MSPLTLCKLGRVSNLPTVWSNMLCAGVLSHTDAGLFNIIIVGLALSLAYLGGMFLNDAIDAEWDRQHAPDRPISRGEAQRNHVYLLAIVCLIAAPLCLLLMNHHTSGNASAAFWWCCALVACIAAYNWSHKWFRHSSLLMGLCRGGVYLTTASALGQINALVLAAAISIVLYIAGLTRLARDEHLSHVADGARPARSTFALLLAPLALSIALGYSYWLLWITAGLLVLWLGWKLQQFFFTPKPDIKAGIGALLAAIPLTDATLAASQNAWLASLVCCAIFFTIPPLQRRIAAS